MYLQIVEKHGQEFLLEEMTTVAILLHTNPSLMEVTDDWCGNGWGASCVSLDISQWAGNAGVKIAFETWSGYGNPLFIDNISVSQYVGQEEIISDGENIIIFPNPNSGSFKIEIPENFNFERIQIQNYLGQIVLQKEITNKTGTVNINLGNSFQPGIYILQIAGNDKLVSRKVILK